MNLFSTYSSIDTLTSDAFLADALGVALPPSKVLAVPPAAPPSPPAKPPSLVEGTDEWTENFGRTLQAQHARIRQFLQSRDDRWRQISANFTRQIEKLQAQVHALTAVNEDLGAQMASGAAQGELAQLNDDASARYLMAMDDIRDLKARNAELQRQLLAAPTGSGRGSEPAGDRGGDWETQKRRMLAELESDDRQDAESIDRRSKIEELVARTDKIIAEKDREIEELQHLLNNQSDSIGSLALGAAALEQVLDQDEIIREERLRLQQVQEELREKLRHAEIEHAMERARLARREAEIEERLRNGESRNSAAEVEAEALAPTGRPVRGRWRTQMGLDNDAAPDNDRGRR